MSDVKGTLRQLVRYAKLSKDERVLRESGFLSEEGNVTDVGRRIIADVLWEDNADLRKTVVAAIRKTLPKVKKGDCED